MNPERVDKISRALLQVSKDHAVRSNPDADDITPEMYAKAAREVVGMFTSMFALVVDLVDVSLTASFEMTKAPKLALMGDEPGFIAGYTIAFGEMMQEMRDAGESIPKNERLMALITQITLALSSPNPRSWWEEQ